MLLLLARCGKSFGFYGVFLKHSSLYKKECHIESTDFCEEVFNLMNIKQGILKNTELKLLTYIGQCGLKVLF
jgi:hypothetical protein